MDTIWQDTLQALERQLLDPATRKDRAAVTALLADDFREFGKSGRAYTKAEILDALAAEPEPGRRIELAEFHAVPLGPEAALVTYCSMEAGAMARRCSVWVWRNGLWQMLFHQGTPVPFPPEGFSR